MTLTELLSKGIENSNEFFEDTDENDEIVKEAKIVGPEDYKRKWVEFPKNEKHYSKKTGNRLYGYYEYEHRAKAGCKYNDGKVVHHKDNNKHNNNNKNLQVTDRSGHCIIDPNARKFTNCKRCGKKEHFSHHLCQACYMRQFRKGKFGNYDKSKNYSKDER